MRQKINENILKEIITEELNKAEVASMINQHIDSTLSSKEFEKAVKEITAKSLENLFKTLWNRSNSWRGGITQG